LKKRPISSSTSGSAVHSPCLPLRCI